MPLMYQFAFNAAFNAAFNDFEDGGLLSINGPQAQAKRRYYEKFSLKMLF